MDKEEWQKKLRSSPVRVQWDPERDLSLQSLEYRSEHSDRVEWGGCWEIC
jgi:hypothetical protein